MAAKAILIPLDEEKQGFFLSDQKKMTKAVVGMPQVYPLVFR